MHQSGYRLDFVDARVGARHDNVLEAWRQNWLLFGRKNATFSGSREARLDMPYKCCLQARQCVERLPVVSVSLRGASSLSKQVVA